MSFRGKPFIFLYFKHISELFIYYFYLSKGVKSVLLLLLDILFTRVSVLLLKQRMCVLLPFAYNHLPSTVTETLLQKLSQGYEKIRSSNVVQLQLSYLGDVNVCREINVGELKEKTHKHMVCRAFV